MKFGGGTDGMHYELFNCIVTPSITVTSTVTQRGPRVGEGVGADSK